MSDPGAVRAIHHKPLTRLLKVGLALVIAAALAVGGTVLILQGGREHPHELHPAPTVASTPNGLIAFQKVVAITSVAQDSTTVNSETQEIFVVNPDGTSLRQLTMPPASNIEPAWSPDGRRLAFTQEVWIQSAVHFTNVLVMNADGSGQVGLTHCHESSCSSSEPAWSPDGKRIAFSSRGGLAVMSADGSGQRVLCTRSRCAPSFGITWSQDGTWIEFIREMDGPPGYLLLAIRPDGTSLQTLYPKCVLPLCFDTRDRASDLRGCPYGPPMGRGSPSCPAPG